MRALLGLILLGIMGWIVIQGAAGIATQPIAGLSGPADHRPDPNRIAMEKFKIASFKWGQQYNMMTVHFTFQNDNDFAVKDVEVRCDHAAPSGTVIDSNTRTIYEVFQPKSRRTIKDFNMGFIHSQAAKSGCYVRRLVAIR